MLEFYENTYPIRAYDLDYNNRIKIVSLFNCMQDAAAAHAEILQLGYNSLSEKKLFWILSWVKIEVENFPSFGETIKIKTWAKSRYKFYSLRDFFLMDGSNDIFARATTAWILLKAENKRPADMNSLAVSIPYQNNMHALDSLPEREKPDSSLLKNIYAKVVGYSDLDVNQHVNNARYVEFCMDCYHKDFHDKHSINSFSISFLSESKYGDVLSLKKITNNNSDIISAENEDSGKRIVSAVLNWKLNT